MMVVGLLAVGSVLLFIGAGAPAGNFALLAIGCGMLATSQLPTRKKKKRVDWERVRELESNLGIEPMPAINSKGEVIDDGTSELSKPATHCNRFEERQKALRRTNRLTRRELEALKREAAGLSNSGRSVLQPEP